MNTPYRIVRSPDDGAEYILSDKGIPVPADMVRRAHAEFRGRLVPSIAGDVPAGEPLRVSDDCRDARHPGFETLLRHLEKMRADPSDPPDQRAHYTLTEQATSIVREATQPDLKALVAQQWSEVEGQHFAKTRLCLPDGLRCQLGTLNTICNERGEFYDVLPMDGTFAARIGSADPDFLVSMQKILTSIAINRSVHAWTARHVEHPAFQRASAHFLAIRMDASEAFAHGYNSALDFDLGTLHHAVTDFVAARGPAALTDDVFDRISRKNTELQLQIAKRMPLRSFGGLVRVFLKGHDDAASAAIQRIMGPKVGPTITQARKKDPHQWGTTNRRFARTRWIPDGDAETPLVDLDVEALGSDEMNMLEYRTIQLGCPAIAAIPALSRFLHRDYRACVLPVIRGSAS